MEVSADRPSKVRTRYSNNTQGLVEPQSGESLHQDLSRSASRPAFSATGLLRLITTFSGLEMMEDWLERDSSLVVV